MYVENEYLSFYLDWAWQLNLNTVNTSFQQRVRGLLGYHPPSSQKQTWLPKTYQSAKT